MQRPRRAPSDEELATLARTLVGGTLVEAQRRAARARCTLRDRSGPGWHTDDLVGRRIDVVVRDGVVVEAVVG